MNEPSTSARRRRRFSRGKIAIAAAVVALAGYGAWTYFGASEDESEYIFGQVTMGNIEDLVTATGTLEPRDYVDVGAQVSGQIEEIFVEVGDVVKAGDRLASIDATTAAARVEAQQASLAAAKISLETQYENLAKAKRDYERQQNLLAEDATTREQAANAETTYLNAQRQIDQSKAQITQQEANMRIDANNLRYTSIVAPIDGTVMSIEVKEGQTINASQSAPTVLRLADLNTMTVRTDVSEADVAKVTVGMPVYFTTLGAGSERRYHGTVKRREPTPKVQNSVVLFPVLFDVDNEGGNLLPSATAQVFFIVAEARNVLTVPMSALQQGQQIAREMGLNMQGGPGRGDRNAATAQNADGAGAAPAGSVMPGAGAPPAGAGDGPPRGGFGGGQGPSPEQMEQIRQRMAQGGGMPGGFGGGGQPPSPEQMEQFRQRMGQGGGFGGMRQGDGNRPGQQRRGVVMVKKADGSLEARQVVIGVTDRVYGQVLEGLEEGEEVVIGRTDTQAAAAPVQQQQNNFRGGGFRPF